MLDWELIMADFDWRFVVKHRWHMVIIWQNADTEGMTILIGSNFLIQQPNQLCPMKKNPKSHGPKECHNGNGTWSVIEDPRLMFRGDMNLDALASLEDQLFVIRSGMIVKSILIEDKVHYSWQNGGLGQRWHHSYVWCRAMSPWYGCFIP